MVRSAKAPGQNSIGTGGQYSLGRNNQDRFPLDAMLDDVYGSDSDELAPEEDGNWRSEALGWDPVLEENIFRAAN